MPSDSDDGSVIKFTRKSPLTPTLKLCPKCLSPLQTMGKLGGWLLPQEYYCTECGYQGLVFVEKEYEVKKGEKP